MIGRQFVSDSVIRSLTLGGVLDHDILHGRVTTTGEFTGSQGFLFYFEIEHTQNCVRVRAYVCTCCQCCVQHRRAPCLSAREGWSECRKAQTFCSRIHPNLSQRSFRSLLLSSPFLLNASQQVHERHHPHHHACHVYSHHSSYSFSLWKVCCEMENRLINVKSLVLR